MSFNSLEKIMINNSQQWLLVRGKSTNNPLILHVQAGPGLPMIPEAGAMEKLLHLENNYLVGMDIDVPTANKYAIEFAISKAKEKNNATLLKQAIDLSNISITNARQFQKRAKLLADLGGIKKGSSYNQVLISTISNMIFS